MPSRLYNVFNSKGRWGWLFAANEERAVQLCLANGIVKDVKNLTLQDITDSVSGDPGVDDILEEGREGHGAIEMKAYTFAEIFSKERSKPDPGVWICHPMRRM